jgi:hypothetical protein
MLKRFTIFMSGLLFCVKGGDRRYLRNVADYTASFIRAKSSISFTFQNYFLAIYLCMSTYKPPNYDCPWRLFEKYSHASSRLLLTQTTLRRNFLWYLKGGRYPVMIKPCPANRLPSTRWLLLRSNSLTRPHIHTFLQKAGILLFLNI